MTCKLDTAFESAAEHCATLAMTPGWWQYARQRVAELEACKSGLWLGLQAEVKRRIIAAGFRPHPDEIPDWSEPQNKLVLQRHRW